MKASVRWLRELCPQLPADVGALAARLTSAGLEVEGREEFGAASDDCVVASVVAVRPHPSRSGLRLVTVDRGGVRREVVCGAPNVPDPGGLVVLAPLGARLPAKGIAIEARAIGGIASEGMLCSEAELGLGDDGDGILILAAGAAAPGTRLADALPASRDTILEIGLTPNRPDGLGHIGLAREAAALFEVPFVAPAAADPARVLREDPSRYASIAIEDAEGCPHYAGLALVDVRVARSPEDVRWRLASLGVRPISNVVDVTNLVMLEFGHPMHAFDLDEVRGRAIVVRRARAGEALRTLDGVDRRLDADDLVICDGEGPVALAGVMGGGNSEIRATTRRVLLECAYFDPRTIRRAARRHGLHTEASHRFERGVDWGDTRAAIARGAELVSALAGATAVDPLRFVEARPLTRRLVTLRHERVRAVLGADFERAPANTTLGRLGFGCRSSEPGLDVWEVPSFRPDVSREVDLVEEIARVRGYDALPAIRPAMRASRDAGPVQALLRRVRDAAVGCGLSEAVTYAFVSPRDLQAVGAPPAIVTLQNPLGDQHSVMRTSLLPGLLAAVARAQRHGERDARLFTAGPVFVTGAAPGGAADLEERPSFAAVLAGERSFWLSKPQAVDVWDAKGLARALVLRLTRHEPAVTLAMADERPARLHPRGAAWLEVEGKRVGSIGPIHPDVSDAFEVQGAVVVVELDLGAVEAAGARAPRFTPLPRFPASKRDLAIVVDNLVPAGVVEQAVRDVAGELAEEVQLFDRFVGGNVPAGHASLALRVVYRAPDRTLTDSEVDARHAQILAAVQKRFGATLRS